MHRHARAEAALHTTGPAAHEPSQRHINMELQPNALHQKLRDNVAKGIWNVTGRCTST